MYALPDCLSLGWLFDNQMPRVIMECLPVLAVSLLLAVAVSGDDSADPYQYLSPIYQSWQTPAAQSKEASYGSPGYGGGSPRQGPTALSFLVAGLGVSGSHYSNPVVRTQHCSYIVKTLQ